MAKRGLAKVKLGMTSHRQSMAMQSEGRAMNDRDKRWKSMDMDRCAKAENRLALAKLSRGKQRQRGDCGAKEATGIVLQLK